jgi:Glycosyl hydrolase family 26
MLRPASILALLIASSLPGKADNNVLLPPPPGKLYCGVYPGGVDGEEADITLKDVISYETAIGRRVAWVYFSNNWYASRAFPVETATWIRSHGAVPYIRLMLRSEDHKPGQGERTFSMEAILRGNFDEDFRAWAHAAREFGTPLLAEFGTEMNGHWFGWNGKYHGGERTDGFGDPHKADGPERFVAAWRHIVKLIRGEGAHNITWVWHPDANDHPDEAWNRFENYYPGDDVVDWVGSAVTAISRRGMTGIQDLFATSSTPRIIERRNWHPGSPSSSPSSDTPPATRDKTPSRGRQLHSTIYSEADGHTSSDSPGGTSAGKMTTIPNTTPPCACKTILPSRRPLQRSSPRTSANCRRNLWSAVASWKGVRPMALRSQCDHHHELL